MELHLRRGRPADDGSADSFGNRTQQSWGTNNVWAQYNSTNNRIASTGQAPGGYGYDAGGNTQNDGINRYWYDAEGQLCAVQNQVIGTVTQYIYDAEGARIGTGTLASAPATNYSTCSPPMSSGFTLTKRWLVGLGGDQVTELSEQGPPTPQTESWAHSNVFSAARLTATYDTNSLHFELADPLGTKRVQTNTAGIVEEWYVSLPFGDVLTPIPNPACTPAIHCYAEDATEHHFTGKERDTESGNDYFMARYYTSALGRFTSPDWSAKVMPVPYALMGDPQSLNLYAYVANNPVTHVDPDGHCDGWACQQVMRSPSEQKLDDKAQANAVNDASNKQVQQQGTAHSESHGTTTTITHADGSVEVRTGTAAFRNNNEGNIRPGDFADSQGAIGKDPAPKPGHGPWAVFENSAAGHAALIALLNTSSVGDRTIEKEMLRYASSPGDDPAAYAKTIAGKLNVPVTTKISALTPTQKEAVAQAIKVQEGSSGTVREQR